MSLNKVASSSRDAGIDVDVSIPYAARREHHPVGVEGSAGDWCGAGL